MNLVELTTTSLAVRKRILDLLNGSNLLITRTVAQGAPVGVTAACVGQLCRVGPYTVAPPRTEAYDWYVAETLTVWRSVFDSDVSDASYDASSWDLVTDKAPSKSAIRDKIVAMDAEIATKGDAGDLGTAAFEDLGTITGKIPIIGLGNTITIGSGTLSMGSNLTLHATAGSVTTGHTGYVQTGMGGFIRTGAGGKIDTTGTGVIALGDTATRTTILGQATIPIDVLLPTAAGTLARLEDVRVVVTRSTPPTDTDVVWFDPDTGTFSVWYTPAAAWIANTTSEADKVNVPTIPQSRYFQHSITTAELSHAATLLSTANGITVTCQTTTGYVKYFNADGTTAIRDVSVSPAFTIPALASPYTTKLVKFYALVPCNVSGSVSGEITYLTCVSNQITHLDVYNCPAITYLSCGSNRITSLDLTNNAALEDLYCGGNQLSELNLSNNILLTSINAADNNLTTLNTSNNAALHTLLIGINNITALDLSNNVALRSINCQYNQLAELSVAQNTLLTVLYANGNNLGLASVNGILASLDAFGETGGYCHIEDGTNATPTNTVAIGHLGDKFWEVSTN